MNRNTLRLFLGICLLTCLCGLQAQNANKEITLEDATQFLSNIWEGYKG